jgi:dTDP-4-dehydrorhamnose reductase
MKVLVLGGGGMLGHKLVQVLGRDLYVFTTVRKPADSYAHLGVFEPERTFGGIDAEDVEGLRDVISRVRPEVVVNAVGLVKQLPGSSDVIQALTLNSIFPHRLAELSMEFSFRLICISTDCVFSGEKGNYSEDDLPDARDLYGQSKCLGEVVGPHTLTVRTSIIGRELDTSHGLVEWFLANSGKKVEGYTNAIFSGFTTEALAGILSFVIREYAGLSGLYHVSSEPINKYQLLRLLKSAFGVDIEIVPTDEVMIDRSLDSRRFREVTDFHPATWADMVGQMASDPTKYNKWR